MLYKVYSFVIIQFLIHRSHNYKVLNIKLYPKSNTFSKKVAYLIVIHENFQFEYSIIKVNYNFGQILMRFLF